MTDKSCEICYEPGNLVVCTQCVHEWCLECHSKMYKCPYCRIVFVFNPNHQNNQNSVEPFEPLEINIEHIEHIEADIGLLLAQYSDQYPVQSRRYILRDRFRPMTSRIIAYAIFVTTTYYTWEICKSIFQVI
jgi:hypothetical protein